MTMPRRHRDAVLARVPTKVSQRAAWPVVKRCFDIGLAVILLTLLAPVLLVIALILKRDSPGPAIFRQERCGRGGQRFTVLKFRTMSTDVSAEPHRRYIAALAAGECPGNGLKKLTGDPRVTRAGAFLRRTSLDELPQLVNVVRGQMSIIGPRPALDYELQFYEEEHFERFSVRPGLTGLWQVEGRSELGFREMLDLDVQYARAACARLDAEILWRTPFALARRRAA